ncbi:MAG: extracellular solute-binding protein [Anaerolineae bacterium]|nr:extracellular solute-binding protein [Anaerolineae bacterium]
MKNSRRFLILLAALSLVLVSLGTTARAQDKVTVKWWDIFTTPQTQVDYVQKIADDYMKMHPNVTVEITNLENEAFKAKLATVMQGSASGGEIPDLFHSWGGGVLKTYADAGLLRDIGPELSANGDEWKNSFSTQSALNLFAFDGKYYGVPTTWGAVGFWYNKELFDKAGITETPKTWTELIDAVKKLQAAGITPFTIGEKDKWPGHFWWVYLAVRTGGQKAFDAAYGRTGTFADPPFVQAGQLLKDLVDMNPFPEGFLGLDYGHAAGIMGDGKAAMELMGQWSPGVQQGNAADGKGIPDKLGWFSFPMVEGGAGDASDVFGGGDGIAVGKDASPEAIDFLKYVTSTDVQKGFVELNVGFIPTNKDAEGSITDPLLKDILAARNGAKYFQLYYDQYLPPAIAQAVLDATQGIFAGTTSPEEAAQAIEDVAAMELVK